ncbi:hypothetical protein E2C01_041429 [Portunus trituberculatus]|uniref:Uncharacterized protein n=1 Tax=Portunus trituberculatus TaxID=210409 RepID=A0A5B7FQE2_PORTR|nr:hypothetical protein [Portunus trituberculatus]
MGGSVMGVGHCTVVGVCNCRRMCNTVGVCCGCRVRAWVVHCGVVQQRGVGAVVRWRKYPYKICTVTLTLTALPRRH